jgi:hypothetical protein
LLPILHHCCTLKVRRARASWSAGLGSNNQIK